MLQAPGFVPSFQEWWPARAVIQVGDPVRVPECPCPCEAEAVWCSMQANVLELERRLLKVRCKEAAERRARQPHVIFQDMCRPKAAPVDTLLEVHRAQVAEVRLEESVVVLSKDVEWLPTGHFSIDGRPVFPDHVESDAL